MVQRARAVDAIYMALDKECEEQLAQTRIAGSQSKTPAARATGEMGRHSA